MNFSTDKAQSCLYVGDNANMTIYILNRSNLQELGRLGRSGRKRRRLPLAASGERGQQRQHLHGGSRHRRSGSRNLSAMAEWVQWNGFDYGRRSGERQIRGARNTHPNGGPAADRPWGLQSVAPRKLTGQLTCRRHTAKLPFRPYASCDILERRTPGKEHPMQQKPSRRNLLRTAVVAPPSPGKRFAPCAKNRNCRR